MQTTNELGLTAFSITLTVEGQMTLFLMLDDSGAVNRMGGRMGGRMGDRMGGATSSPLERDMYIGHVSPSLFEQAIISLTDEVLAHAGGYASDSISGKPAVLQCVLVAGDREYGYEFRYGTRSTGPPRELRELVTNALELTEPWYQAQRQAAAAQSPAQG